MNFDLKRVIDQVRKDKGIKEECIVEALEAAMLTASRKKFGANKEIESQYNPEIGEIELFQFQTIVEKVNDPDKEITLEKARELDPEAEMGDSLGVKLPSNEFGRIAAQTAKQVIIQRVRAAERDMIFEEYKDRKGELISGFVRRFEKRNIIVDIGKTEALLPEREQIPRESFRAGDRIKAYLSEVRADAKGPQIILSRVHQDFMVKLFSLEVPELYEGIVTVKGAVREPGSRAKIAVASNDSQVDPVGACVGMRGSRVQSVVQELRGEKIDLVAWDEDIASYICNALSPAEIVRVVLDEDAKSVEVVVPDDQLSLAIGKKGQNVRLASMLVGWNIDITTEAKAEKLSLDEMLEEELAAARIVETEKNNAVVEGDNKDNPDDISLITGVGGKTADTMREQGLVSLKDVASAKVSDLASISGIGEKKAENIIKSAKEKLGE